MIETDYLLNQNYIYTLSVMVGYGLWQYKCVCMVSHSYEKLKEAAMQIAKAAKTSREEIMLTYEKLGISIQGLLPDDDEQFNRMYCRSFKTSITTLNYSSKNRMYTAESEEIVELESE